MTDLAISFQKARASGLFFDGFCAFINFGAMCAISFLPPKQ
jgi:hypothetical protein